MSKALIVCCDGTWQGLDSETPTNVVKLAQAIDRGEAGRTQVVYYDEGLGTENLNRFGGGLFGRGIDRNICDAYRFLALNHEPGDDVYLFGFSRGAYTVRSLAGMIHNSGLVARRHLRSIPRAYALYRDREVHPSDEGARTFRRDHGERIPITLLGAWDTVGSLGVPDQFPFLPLDRWVNARYRFHDTTLSSSIRNARHAVSIDEHRRPFDVTRMMQKGTSRDAGQTLEERWFPGDHGAVGGGDARKEGLSNIALNWMLDAAEGLGLLLDRANVNTGVDEAPDLELPAPGFSLLRLGGGLVRPVSAYEDLHPCVKIRWGRLGDRYRPKNLVPFREQLDAA